MKAEELNDSFYFKLAASRVSSGNIEINNRLWPFPRLALTNEKKNVWNPRACSNKLFRFIIIE